MKHTYTSLYLLITLVFLQGCTRDSINVETPNTTLLIQAISNNLDINEMIKTLSSRINKIIKEELQLDQNYDFDFFLPKKLQRVTLYYLHDANQKNIKLIISELDNINGTMKIFESNISSTVNFFGDQQDELVVIIDDINETLYNLNYKIKKSMHTFNTEHFKQHNKNLFNIAQSERFEYLPHMGLGRIRSQSIKNHIKDSLQTNAFFEKIKKRILLITKEMVEDLFKGTSSKVAFEKIGLLDSKKQSYLKEWMLQK